MKTAAKINFFSFLGFGILFLVLGVILFQSDKWSAGSAKALIIAGTGQLVIFNVLMLILNWQYLRDLMKRR